VTCSAVRHYNGNMASNILKVGLKEKFSFGFNVFKRDTDNVPVTRGWGDPVTIDILEGGAAALTVSAALISAAILF